MIRNLKGELVEFKVDGIKYVPGYWSIEVEKKRHFSLPGEPDISKGPKFSWKGSFPHFYDESTYNCLATSYVNGVVVKDFKFYISENGYYVGDVYITSCSKMGNYQYDYDFVDTGELRYVEK